MSLPDNTNELLAVMEGWTQDANDWISPTGTRLFCPPDYRACLDAIEPLFTRLCPGWGGGPWNCKSEKEGYMVHAWNGQEWQQHDADTFAAAMCLAVLATRKPEATTPD